MNETEIQMKEFIQYRVVGVLTAGERSITQIDLPFPSVELANTFKDYTITFSKYCRLSVFKETLNEVGARIKYEPLSEADFKKNK